MIKYSKSFLDILSIKKDYFNFNTRELLKVKRINKFFVKVIDKLQSVLDREQLSSELHFVIKK